MPSQSCCFGTCINDIRCRNKDYMEGVFFVRLPNPKYHRAKCEKWVRACGRTDLTVDVITSKTKCNNRRYFWICSKHFVGGNGPSANFPDPVVNTDIVENLNGKRHKVSTEQGNSIQTFTAEVFQIAELQGNDNSTNVSSASISENAICSFHVDSTSVIFQDPVVNIEMGESLALGYLPNETDNTTNTPHLLAHTSEVCVPSRSERVQNPVENIEMVSCDDYDGISKTSEPDQTQTHSLTTEPNTGIIQPLVNDSLSEDVEDTSCTNIKDLENNVSSPGWLQRNLGHCIEFIKIEGSSVTINFKIHENFETSLVVLNNQIPTTHKIFETIPNIINDRTTLLSTLTEVGKWEMCCGNEDEDLRNVYLSRRRRSGYVCKLTEAVRSSSCLLITKPKDKNKRCQFCRTFRCQLRSLRYRHKLRQSNCEVKKLKFKSMNRQCLIKKLKEAKKIQNALKRKNVALQKKICEFIENDGIKLDKVTSSAFEELLNTHANTETTPFTKQFLLEQVNMLNKNSKGRKWHPAIIKWCIYMRAKSPAAYKALQETGALILPSERTLFNYTSKMIERPGIRSEAFSEFKKQFEATVKVEHEKYVCLSIDEMKIRQDLVYHKSTGEMSGFVHLDNSLNQIREIERSCTKVAEKDQKLDLATHVLQVMVRGVTTSLQFPLAFFPTSTLDADTLNHLMWRIIERLEGIHCRVIAITGDGASTNRKFFNINICGKYTHSCVNRLARDERRELYFIFDVPHLMKTTRNCWAKSGLPKLSKTKNKKPDNKKKPLPPRRLNNADQDILWSHLIRLYDIDSKNVIRKLPKLKYEHVYLDSYSRMKVKLATQVLSESVAFAMEDTLGDEAKETVRFIRLMNKFFDTMNVSNLTTGIRKRNENLEPFKSEDDVRLKWIEEDFLNHFTDWENYANEKGGLTTVERKMMQLSQETLEGLRMTSKSMVEVIRLLLRKGAPYVLTTHLNQDNLEQHFGKIRSLAGGCDNPNIRQYGQNNVKINILRQFVRAPKNGNTSI